MHAYKFKIIIPEDRQLRLQLPEEIPPGPAELLILFESPPAKEPEEPSEEERPLDRR